MDVDVDELKERILRDGKNLGGGILKVDSFVNHHGPSSDECLRQEFARRFANVGATKVLTAEISGIAPALTTAIHLGLPVVYARKHKPITMPDQVYLTLAPSHTKGRMVELIVSPEYLANGEKVLSSTTSSPADRRSWAWRGSPKLRFEDRRHRRVDREKLRVADAMP